MSAIGVDITAADSDGDTALHRAGSDDAANMLLEAGLRINALDGDGNTPLATAVSHRRARVVRKRLAASAGRVVNWKNKYGKMALRYCGRWEEVQGFLLEAGADPAGLRRWDW
jgi:ankyrin repeat protein